MRKFTTLAALAAVTAASVATVASAQVTFLQDYEGVVEADLGTNNSLFLRRPSLSGSSLNVTDGGVGDLALVPGLAGSSQALQVTVNADTAGDYQAVRFLVNSTGNVDLDIATGGTIGFLLSTADAPSALMLGFTIEDTGRADLDVLGPTSVTNNGDTTLYEFAIPGPATTFDAVFGSSGLGDGNITGSTYNPDDIALFVDSAAASYTFTIDSIAFNPTGDLSSLIPEPTSLGLIGLAGMGLIRRRK